MGDDVQQLKLLSIFHYVAAVLLAVVACIPVIHLLIGILMVTAPAKMAGGGQPPPLFMGWMFILIASAAILGGWTIAAMMALAGRFLAQRQRRGYCLVVAAVECLWTPFGTVLGILTIIVLIRPSVIELFDERRRLDLPRDDDEPEGALPAPPLPEGPDVRIKPGGEPGIG
jgi:hypothetical protein